MSEETNQQQAATEALCEAIRNNDVQGVEKALAAKADVNAKDAAGKSPLFYLDKKQTSTAFVQMYELLLKHGVKVNLKPGRKSLSRLSQFVNLGTLRYKTIEICRMLLERGADVNVDDGYPLNRAVYQNAAEFCRLLLEHGADPNLPAQLAWGLGLRQPLWQAVENGNTEICKLLLERGADVNGSAGFEAPLCRAIEDEKHTEICKILLEYGADAGSGNGHTLRWAAWNGSIEICKLLLEHGADVNAKNESDGETPLHMAAKRGHVEVCKLLLEHGANVNTKNDQGRTPLYLADNNDETETCELLRAHGAE